MRILRLLAPVLLLLPRPAAGQIVDTLDVARSNLPRWVHEALSGDLRALGYYEVEARLNPFYQSGDFDGDRRLDAALLIRDVRTGKHGIAIFLQGRAEPLVIGAGRAFGNGGDDFDWMDVWRVEPAGAYKQFAPSARGDVLIVEKRESAGGLIAWDGRRFFWEQWGD
jgi:hypothetical protein